MNKQNKQLRLKEYQHIFNTYPLLLVYHYNTLVYNHTTLEEIKQLLLNDIEKTYDSSKVKVQLKVVKNTLVKEAIKTTKYRSALPLFTGPTLILYSNDASPKVCDIISNWKKQSNILYLLGGKYYDEYISAREFDELSLLPNDKGVIIQQIIAAMQGSVIELNNLLSLNQSVLYNTLTLHEQTNSKND